MQSGDHELISFSDLSKELRNRGIIRRSSKVLRTYATEGRPNKDTGELVKLRTLRIGHWTLTSVQWFEDFLKELNEDAAEG